MIANMRATFLNLQEKKDYEHKNVLCDLELKYSEMELQYNSKVEKIGRLEEDIKELKKIDASKRLKGYFTEKWNTNLRDGR